MAANNSTGAITWRLDTPAARMATISPSDAIRPNPTRIPISTPNGIVNGSTGGRTSASRVNTVRGPGLLPTSSLNSVSALCRNMTNVASRVPSTELVRISRNTYRPRRRTAVLPLYVRRRHHGQLGLLLFGRMQLQIVDQDGRRHHAGFRGKRRAPDQRERRLVVQELEHRLVVPRRQDVFQRPRRESPESQPPHQFLAPVREDFVNQQRRAYRVRRALRGLQQRPHFVQRRRRGKIHLAHNHPVRLVARLDQLDQFLLRSEERRVGKE